MSELEFRAIPQSTDFKNALIRVDQAFRAQGGASVVAQGEANFSIVDNEAMQQDMAISRYSTLLIPYEADKDELSTYEPAHAFSRGFMLARPVNDDLYGSNYDFSDYYSSLNGWMLSQGAEKIQDERAWFEANSLLLRKYSEGGLERIGEQGQKVIDGWADGLYADPSLSRIFSLGCGALLMSGIIHQRSVNEYLLTSANFQSSFDNDLIAFMSHGNEGSNE